MASVVRAAEAARAEEVGVVLEAEEAAAGVATAAFPSVGLSQATATTLPFLRAVEMLALVLLFAKQVAALVPEMFWLAMPQVQEISLRHLPALPFSDLS